MQKNEKKYYVIINDYYLKKMISLIENRISAINNGRCGNWSVYALQYEYQNLIDMKKIFTNMREIP